ncbi:MAG: hypothetical protein IT565_14045 [Rhodospirillales bacterium]|nr:hypothetical protein [Rhodospirillales bacterium]
MMATPDGLQRQRNAIRAEGSAGAGMTSEGVAPALGLKKKRRLWMWFLIVAIVIGGWMALARSAAHKEQLTIREKSHDDQKLVQRMVTQPDTIRRDDSFAVLWISGQTVGIAYNGQEFTMLAGERIGPFNLLLVQSNGVNVELNGVNEFYPIPNGKTGSYNSVARPSSSQRSIASDGSRGNPFLLPAGSR